MRAKRAVSRPKRITGPREIPAARKAPPGAARPLVRIGLVFGYELSFYRDILNGIKSFAAERPHWVFTPLRADRRELQSPAARSQDGFIAHVVTPVVADVLGKWRRPVVNVGSVLPELPFPRVAVDHEAVGRLAARHLLERGLRQFAFLGYPRRVFSVGREAGFRAEIETAGYSMEAFHDRKHKVADTTDLWRWNEDLLAWLQSLSKPVGLLASHDNQGVQVSEYCRHLNLNVPEEMAIVGVDNDDWLCELARPALSSVALPSERIGHEAARLMEQILSGRRPVVTRLELPPVRLVVRASSDIQALPDAELAAAVRYIREHADQPINVANLLAAVPASRRSLERRFRHHLRRGIWEEIRRAHLERAQMLLIETELPMSVVAERSGFNDSRRLSVAFRQATGDTPTHFRRLHRAPGAV